MAERTYSPREDIELALLELLHDKPYRDITVAEIARSAGISRQGLYLHFRDKDAILQDIIGRMYSDLMSDIGSRNISSVDELVAAYTCAVRQWSGELRLFAQNDLCGIVGTSFVAALVELPTSLPGLDSFESEEELKLITTFWGSAFISVYTRWLAGGLETPDAELNRILTDLMKGSYFSH